MIHISKKLILKNVKFIQKNRGIQKISFTIQQQERGRIT